MFRTKEEKYDKSIMAYNEIVQTYGGTKSLPYALLGIANAYYNLGKYKEAADGYNTFLEKYSKHLLAPEAYAGRAYANYEQGLYKPALDDLKLAMDNFKDAYNLNDMKLKAAECYYKLNETEAAKQAYVQIISGTADSYWAGVAREKLKEIK
jgi:tetratricopeptide (TPR) repeat protein